MFNFVCNPGFGFVGFANPGGSFIVLTSVVVSVYLNRFTMFFLSMYLSICWVMLKWQSGHWTISLRSSTFLGLSSTTGLSSTIGLSLTTGSGSSIIIYIGSIGSIVILIFGFAFALCSFF